MSLTKTEKNQNPKLYGYGSLEQLMADPSRFGDDPNNPLTHWVSFTDEDNHLRFVPCTEAYFHHHRNENRNEKRREIRFKQECPISIDDLQEKHNFEFADPAYKDMEEAAQEQELIDYLLEMIREFNDKDRLIIELHSNGFTDAEIAEKLDKARSTIQERRIKLLKLLRKKIENFQK